MKLKEGVDFLQEILNRQTVTANDLLSCIFTGESVMRKLATTKAELELFGSTRPFSTAMLIDRADHAVGMYQNHLKFHSKLFIEILNGLEDDLDEALQDIRNFADGSNTLDAEDTLRNLDQVLMTVVAAHRAGVVSIKMVNMFAKIAYDEVKKVSTDTVDLWDEANRRSLNIGDDPDYMNVTEWLESLAQFSYARVSLMVALRRPSFEERKQRAIDYVLARFKEEEERKKS